VSEVPGQRAGEAAGTPVEAADGQSLSGVLERRIADARLTEEAKQLVAEALGSAAESSAPAAQEVYLDSVKVSGFRGIGPEARLALTPTPGVTLVVGRNGSGKSSFAEALEVAFTGRNKRWNGTSSGDVARRTHWRNLHHGDKPSIEVKMQLAGDPGRSTLTCAWADDDVTASMATFRRSGDGKATFDDLGWAEPLDHYRPFLAYSELEGVIGGKPSEMYDAVARILGLGRLSDANNHLAAVEKELKETCKAPDGDLPALRAMLSALDDPRATSALEALDAKADARLAQLTELVGGLPTADGAELHRLRVAAALRGPDLGAVGTAVDRLREAVAVLDDVRASGAEDAHQRAELLDQALRHAQRHPDDADCPVCGAEGRLGLAWAEQAVDQLTALREEARAALAAREGLEQASDELRYLVSRPPAEVPDELREVWQAWASCRQVVEPRELASRAEHAAVTLADACHAVSETAVRRLERLDEGWRAAVGRLGAWLELLRAAEAARQPLREVQAARRWLNRVADELRQERLRPFAGQSQRIWEALRQDSNVALHSLELKGTNKAPQRKLRMDVSVDDMEASALGVMSQGELHSLALSLFLPRASAPDSPFGFVVIDDPVQAMDPAKVHGLARVLHEIGQSRQVVVFTHDTRLRDAFSDLLLPVTVRKVVRDSHSVVKVTTEDDPIKQALCDAHALVKTDDLPAQTLAHVLPGVCRTALEHAFVEAARRRLHRAGRSAQEVDDAVARARRFVEKAALALSDSGGRRDREVRAELRRRFGDEAMRTFDTCNRGAHAATELSDPHQFVKQVEAFAGKVRKP
jgi:ABC-type Mn2+/Zn2+ transport system ATPase subunit